MTRNDMVRAFCASRTLTEDLTVARYGDDWARNYHTDRAHKTLHELAEHMGYALERIAPETAEDAT